MNGSNLSARDGKLYVAEYLNDRIQVFTLLGESLYQVAQQLNLFTSLPKDSAASFTASPRVR